jgi:putative ABC transport system permease protein
LNPITHHLLAWSKAVKVSSLNRKLLRDLWRLKSQGLAIAGVVAAGIAVMVTIFGTLTALSLSMDVFYDRYRFADVFASLKRAPNSLEARLSAIDGISSLETRIVVSVPLDLDGMAEPATGRLISVPEGRNPIINGIDLRRGRLVAPNRPSEVVVSEPFATANDLILNDTISANINGKKRQLTIVGIALTPEYIYALGPGELMPDNSRFGVLWMGRKALAAAFDLDEAFNDVVATLRRDAQTDHVLERLDSILKPYGGIGAYARKDQVSHFFLNNELTQLRAMGTIMPPIFLGVAAFLLNIVITRIVTTEREQIGLLKAFGYTDWEVGLQYLKLVLVLVGAGLVMGLAVGYWLGGGMIGIFGDYYKFPLLSYRVEPQVFSLAAFVSILAGTVGGLGAVRQAVRLSPAVAMAPPMPTVYRRSLVSTLFSRFNVSQPTRMIFRHVTRWPLRTALTITGIAFSVAILVSSLFFLDTVQHVMSVMFFEKDRQTLTVSFVEPRAGTVEEEIRRLPGVLATQPVRSVSARLHAGTRTERTGINGIVTHANLSRLLDTNINPVEPPPGGLALSGLLAKKLGVGVGDIVRVEVMQERRPLKDLPVVQIVEEYIGSSAYMSLDAVNRLMLEGPTVTGIHVLADRNRVDELYQHLKETPAAAGVMITTAALDSFQTTMESTVYVQIAVFVAFATLIAFGVTYNSSRIALSERARALASLRVLGFTRGEVTYILLGELGIQALIALPVGCVLGYGLALLMSPMLNTDMYSFPMIISDSTYGFSVTVVAVSAIVCGFLVKRRVYNFDLVSVLKTRE